MSENRTAKQFLEKLNELRAQEDESNEASMEQVFALAKEFMEMPPGGIEKLLKTPLHEVRVRAVSIMDWQARSKKTSEARRKELFDLYIRRHDQTDDWDLVDRSASYVVGGFLDKYADTMPRTMLRYAIEHLEKEQRKYYLKMKGKSK
ncbi:MAG TPA: DNA alkylation repair protein [Anaerolineales bacterium]|nr:DNA alkylation repair protein [Anaerolineales bacterium]